MCSEFDIDRLSLGISWLGKHLDHMRIKKDNLCRFHVRRISLSLSKLCDEEVRAFLFDSDQLYGHVYPRMSDEEIEALALEITRIY